MQKATIITISKNPQIGVSKKVIKIPIKPGNTKIKDGKMPIIERIPQKIFYQESVVGLVLVKLKKLNHSLLRLKMAETVRITGIKKSVTDGK